MNPEFFKMKTDLENYLGTECVTGLIMLGMYKKAAFMVQIEKCLELLWCFSDVNMYTEIFLTKYTKKQNYELN